MMNLENFASKYPVPKTPEQQLENMILALDFCYTHTPFIKSDPLVSLWREGKLTMEFITEEMDRLTNRTSKLSSNKRAAITMLVKTAYDKFMQANADNENEPKSENNG